ncbi:MAG: helix-turn-helix transcriptional regulator [Microthrixaceae bacterium]|nr:helix-turn-helix transcriptional regulator [Microthrixaceae bacterium]
MLRFRNVDADPGDDVATWPFEAIVAVIDRGLIRDWQPVFAEIRRAPWGKVARSIERYLDESDHDRSTVLFQLAIERARLATEAAEKAEVAERVRAAVARSGLTSAGFASEVGTSASRLSTYATGSVTPSASMLIRIETTSGE